MSIQKVNMIINMSTDGIKLLSIFITVIRTMAEHSTRERCLFVFFF